MLVAAPAALADNGVGLAGPTDDKTVTFFCFGVMGFFVVLVVVMSLIQGKLERRKERRSDLERLAPPGWPVELGEPEAGQEAFLGLALDRGDDFDLALQRGAADLRRQQVVDLEDPGGVVELDLDPHRALLAGLDPHLVDRGGGDRVDALVAGLDRDPGPALGHVERVGDADHAGLQRVGLAAAAVADDRVEDLRGDDRALGLAVGVGEQPLERAAGEEQRVGLVVGAVDRHADVVQQRAAGDHHLGVAVPHPVVGDDRRLDPGFDQQPQQPQGDVEDDLHVDPGVVGHAEPFGVDLGHVPPGAHLLVGVDGVEEALELAVAPGRRPHLRLGDRLLGRLAARPLGVGGRDLLLGRHAADRRAAVGQRAGT